ncbi:MAG: hypothetical protein HY720_12560 [Planctomycetes bacterium]|nr:hypothetical protein [Planctomycetota bacterium]
MEVERAISVLEEVRLRLASCQRFRGFSGTAAILSGAVAVAAGLYQQVEAAYPRTPEEVGFYLHVWLACLAIALVLNYGAVGIWYFRRAERQERRQTHTAAFQLVPALVLGAVLSWVFLDHGLPHMLPGVWYACYGTGLLAARALVPRGVWPVALAFCLAGGFLLLVTDPALPLAWWVMPLGFGLGQMWTGRLLLLDRESERVSP